MKFLSLIFCCAVGVFADINITFIEPRTNQVVSADLLKVVVTVQSTFDLKEVTAKVLDRQAPLAFSPTAYEFAGAPKPGWVGEVNIAGLPRGTYELQVRAEDLLANANTNRVSFLIDRLPILHVDLPINSSVANPLLPVEVSCEDDDAGCVVFTTNFGTITNSILDLTKYDHTSLTVQFQAKDSANQRAFVNRTIYVESNPRLRPVDAAPDEILDATADRLLYKDASLMLAILDRTTRQSTVITPDFALSGFLTPEGAAYVRRGEVYEFPGQSLGIIEPTDSLAVAGKYMIWNNRFTLYRRDTLANNTLTISTIAGENRNSVAENGAVAYWVATHPIYEVYLNDTRFSAPPPPNFNIAPLTDGTRVAWKKADACCNGPFWIAFNDGTGEVALSKLLPKEPQRGTHYQVANGWVAYTDVSTAGTLQVWKRDPAGTKTQATFFGTDSLIELLAPNGDLIFRNSGRKYFNGVDLGVYQGTTLLIDNQWHVRIGRELFALDVASQKPIAIEIANDKVYIRGSGVLLGSSDLTNWTNLGAIDGVKSFPLQGTYFYRLQQ